MASWYYKKTTKASGHLIDVIRNTLGCTGVLHNGYPKTGCIDFWLITLPLFLMTAASLDNETLIPDDDVTSFEKADRKLRNKKQIKDWLLQIKRYFLFLSVTSSELCLDQLLSPTFLERISKLCKISWLLVVLKSFLNPPNHSVDEFYANCLPFKCW